MHRQTKAGTVQGGMQRGMNRTGSGHCEKHDCAASVADSGSFNEIAVKACKADSNSDHVSLSRQPLHSSNAREAFDVKATAVTCTCRRLVS